MLPDPILTLFDTLKIHMYGIMIAVGVLCAFLVLHLYSKQKKLDSRFVDFLFYDAIVSVLVSFGSAVLVQAVYDYIKRPENGFHLGEGMTFLGGLIGGVIVFFAAFLIFRKKLTGRLMDFLPILPCCIAAAHAFGRVGCFFAGCCYGIHSGTWLDVSFPNLPEPVLPTQLYEAAFLFLLFGVLSVLLLKKNSVHTMSVYLIAYGVFRFAIEFIRADERGSFIGPLTPSQFWSIVMVLAGIGLFLFLKKTGKKPSWAIAEPAADKPAAEEPAGEEPEYGEESGYEEPDDGESASEETEDVQPEPDDQLKPDEQLEPAPVEEPEEPEGSGKDQA